MNEPGSYAFLKANGTVVRTYEELRDGSTVALLIHRADADGVPQDDFYDNVTPGDVFEWREHETCWIRYIVDEVSPDPRGEETRVLLAIRWITYAYTGCSGEIDADVDCDVRSGLLPDLGGSSLAAPVRHGPFQIVPEGWTGAVEAPEYHIPASYPWDAVYLSNPDPAVARAFPYWREPELPEGWTLLTLSRGMEFDPDFGYTAEYAMPGGRVGVKLSGYFASDRGWAEKSTWSDGMGVRETRMIDGRPARVIYSPPGPKHSPTFPVTVWVFDPATQTEYAVYGEAGSLRGGNVDAVIAIARSLFQSPESVVSR